MSTITIIRQSEREQRSTLRENSRIDLCWTLAN
ncbi:hypothetical protein EMIT0357P_20191 [Pseudomonas marginalis]